eukprot:24927-Lingulodinium_polyedra.AAC.1
MDLLPGGPLPTEVGAAVTKVVIKQGPRCWGLLRSRGPDVAPCRPYSCFNLAFTLQKRPAVGR